MTEKIIRNYSLFLRIVSEHFSAAAAKHSAKCRAGCHLCCSTGLFSISLLDALSLHENLKRVPANVRKRIVAQANEQLDILEQKNIFSRKKPFLHSAASRNALARKSSGMRCPAQGDDNQCLLYEHRPLLCRIFGPAVRGSRHSVLLTGCGFFSRDIPEADFPILSFYKDEDILQKALFSSAGRKRVTDVSTIIPAALALDVKTRW